MEMIGKQCCQQALFFLDFVFGFCRIVEICCLGNIKQPFLCKFDKDMFEVNQKMAPVSTPKC